jgi:hypothetical protein
MTIPNQDVWDMADHAKEPEYQFFGKVIFDIPWKAILEKGVGKRLFDPATDNADKAVLVIDAQIIPIPEQNITKEVKFSKLANSHEWAGILLPSIKSLGFNSIRDINNHYIRCAMVDSRQKRVDENGNPTGEFWKTWKFVEVFADEAACRAAYAGNGNGHTPAATEQQTDAAPASQPDTTSPDFQTAAKFYPIFVQGACKGKTAADFETVKTEIATKFAGSPIVSKYFTVETPEVLNMIMSELAK